MAKKLIATVNLLWEANTAREMGLGLKGYFAEVQVEYPVEKLETMLINEYYAFDPETLFGLEDPDNLPFDGHRILVSAIESVGNLPAGLEVCSGMGIPDEIDYKWSEWDEEEDD